MGAAEPERDDRVGQAEVRRLRRELAAANAELEALRREVETIRAKMATLRRELAEARAGESRERGGPRDAPTPGGRTDRDGRADHRESRRGEGDADASAGADEEGGETPVALRSPKHLLRAVRTAYAERFKAEREAGELPSLEDVGVWAEGVREELSGRATWLARIEVRDEFQEPGPRRVPGRRAPLPAVVEIVDRGTLEPIDSVPVALDRRSRFTRQVNAQPEQELWQLTLSLEPILILDPERADRGPFDFPPFVGPFVGFDLEAVWLRLQPVDDNSVQEPRPADEAGQGVPR